MKCQECNNEFSPINNRGAEQKYCSTKCRSKSANKRREQRLINTNVLNNIYENKEIKDSPIQHSERISESMDRIQRGETRIASSFGINSDNSLALLKELYEAKNETTFYKLKCESLEKEIIQLNLELEELDSEEEDKYSGMLGGVMEQFKQDPVNTISFTSELINSLFKPKPKQ
jgi:chromosome segregation ATPase